MTDKRRRSEERAEAVAPELHALLSTPVESAHKLLPDGDTAVAGDEELAPGIDCCALCAEKKETSSLCPDCECVQYCCSYHVEQDSGRHALVCKLLRAMQAAAGLQEGAGADKPAATFAPLPAGLDACQHGWHRVVPDTFAAVYPLGREPKEEHSNRGDKPSDAEGDKAEAHAHDAPRSTTKGRAKRARTARATPERHEVEKERLALAVRLAEATSVRTYAYTAAYALSALEPAAKVIASVAAAAAGAGSSNGAASNGAASNGSGAHAPRVLQLVVLGAAAGGELAELDSWQLLEAQLPEGLTARLVFVGPEVPDELAGHVKTAGRLEMHFVQATYDEMMAGHVKKQRHTPQEEGQEPEDADEEVEEGQEGEEEAAGEGQEQAADAEMREAEPQANGSKDGRKRAREDASAAAEKAAAAEAEADTEEEKRMSAAARAAAAEREAAHLKRLLPFEPDIALAFNPGFTVPDYGWADTLEALRSHPVVLVVGTNTLLEADMEDDMLRDGGWAAQGETQPNPYTSLKLLQSGTLANDLYRKNAWLSCYVRAAPAEEAQQGGIAGVAKRVARALFSAVSAPLSWIGIRVGEP